MSYARSLLELGIELHETGEVPAALGIALGLWFSISFQDREALSERLVEASVSYNRPRSFVILDPVQNVNVRLRGSSKLIRQLNPYQVSVQVELSQTHPGTVNVNLGPENVLMPDGTMGLLVPGPAADFALRAAGGATSGAGS